MEYVIGILITLAVIEVVVYGNLIHFQWKWKRVFKTNVWVVDMSPMWRLLIIAGGILSIPVASYVRLDADLLGHLDIGLIILVCIFSTIINNIVSHQSMRGYDCFSDKFNLDGMLLERIQLSNLITFFMFLSIYVLINIF
jgi:hypothetical protein